MNRLVIAILLSSSLAWAEPVLIGDVSYDHVDEGDPFQKAPTAAPSWTAPQPCRAERRAGMMAFLTMDPGQVVPDRVPRAEEHTRSLCAFLSQGETTCFWVGVNALKDLKGIDALLDLGDAPVSVDLRHMHCWPQRTGWKSRHWYITPELLLPFAKGQKTIPAEAGVLSQAPFDLSQGQSTGFWITLKSKDEARPGNYHGSLKLSASGGPPLKLSVDLEILPIRLDRPQDRHWLLYGDVERWNAMSEDQVLAELKDFVNHGFNGLVHAPFGHADLSEIRAGRVRFDVSPYQALVVRCKKAGMPGPHVCSPGGLPGQVRDALGISCDLNKDVWPDELKQGISQAAKAAVEAARDTGVPWYFYGVDEPAGDNTYAIQEYQCWRAGGALTYATFYQIDFMDKASAYLTAPCFVSGLVSEEAKAKEARETCDRTGSEFWWYGTGSYVNPSPQESLMFLNRYGAGLFFWKTGARAQVTWTFCRPHGDVFNDFDGTPENGAEPKDQVTAYPHLLKPNDWSTYQGAIPTIAWESLREGYNDYLYLHALTLAIQAAKSSGESDRIERAAAAEKTMTNLVDSIPWHNPMTRPTTEDTGLSSLRLQQVRRALADQILLLQE